MIRLEENDYYKVKALVKSQNELSVFSVINGLMPGEIFVDDMDQPTVALIKTSECNLIAGSTNKVISQISKELDFWDPLTPDSEEWIEWIPTIHKNSLIRKYQRRHYVLSSEDFIECKTVLKEGFHLEKVDIHKLREMNYDNSEEILDWVDNWGSEDAFQSNGVGYYIHNDEAIVSWSLSDCYSDHQIAIGIHTDERYRKNGFAKIVVSATVKQCFYQGYETIDWLCVDSNKGSIAIAESLGFKQNNTYCSFTSYPPIENLTDLSEAEWYEWGKYLHNVSNTYDFVLWECLYCYIKANDVESTINLMLLMKQKKMQLDYSRLKQFIEYLNECGLATNFKRKEWTEFLAKGL